MKNNDEIKIFKKILTSPYRDYLNSMTATVVSYDDSTGVLVCTVTEVLGSGTYDSWDITLVEQTLFS